MDASSRERTFQYDNELPPLPVPPLEQTLQKYIDSVKPFLSEEAFTETQAIVERFGQGSGKILHAELLKKSEASRNWLEQWWEEVAYLSSRRPLGVLQNPSGTFPAQDTMWPPMEGSQLERGAIALWHVLTFYTLVRKEQIPVDKNRAGTHIFSMDQLRNLFHTCREPGLEQDVLFRYFKTEREGPCPKHIHVICNGHIYKMLPFDDEGNLNTTTEIFRQLTYIKEMSRERGQSIGALSADDRITYAKAFDHLCSLDPANRKHIEIIKTSIMGFILDDGNPKTYAETCHHGIAGASPHNRWFDKSYSLIVTSNGVLCTNLDHAPFDGMAVVPLSQYLYHQLQKNGGDWPHEPVTDRPNIQTPRELIFVTDDRVRRDIKRAIDVYKRNAANYELVCSSYYVFGKDYLKQHRLHPDGVIQLALQLAYYRTYDRPGAAYETATTRQFYHGRTETHRSCTMETIDWCKAMQDSAVDTSTKLALLRTAHDRHIALMIEAASGQGIDRHLLGLYLISRQMGLAVPELFVDKAFSLSGGGGNFPLSTSTLGYTKGLGAIAPMREDGFMCCYRIGTDELQFTVSAFKNCSETDANRFFRQITLALNGIWTLLQSAKL